MVRVLSDNGQMLDLGANDPVQPSLAPQRDLPVRRIEFNNGSVTAIEFESGFALSAATIRDFILRVEGFVG